MNKTDQYVGRYLGNPNRMLAATYSNDQVDWKGLILEDQSTSKQQCRYAVRYVTAARRSYCSWKVFTQATGRYVTVVRKS
jgi:hypothetical protein